MNLYEFAIVLDGQGEMTEELAERLFSAGCDDGTPSSCGGIISIDFAREARDLESAIRTAIADVAGAGLQAKRVEIAAQAAAIGG